MSTLPSNISTISYGSDGLSSSTHTLYTSRATTPDSLLDEMDLGHFNFIVYNSNHRIDGRELDDEFEYDPTEPSLILPFIKNRAHGIPINHSPQYADHWPLGFTCHEEWMRTWYSRPCYIDQYLRQEELFRDGPLLPWIDEHAYKGAAYRLTIDPHKSLIGLPILTHGVVISVQNWNCCEYRYIVDHCIHKDKDNAYLKVVCFDSCSYVYDIRSYRPPFILVVPLSHCDSNIRIHPNIRTKSHNSATIIPAHLKCIFKKFLAKNSRSLWRRFL